MKKLIFFVLIFVSLCITIEALDDNVSNPSLSELHYLPSPKAVNISTLAYRQMAADFYWIESLAYFGGSGGANHKTFIWLERLLNIIITLDPLYQYPYEFAGIVFATEGGDVDKSIEFLERGMKSVSKKDPRYWYFPFYIAFNHMFYKGDYRTAAQYLEQAARFPKSPKYLPILVAKLYSSSNASGTAIPFLQEMLNNTEEPRLKKELKKRLYDMINAENIAELNRAVKIYSKHAGRYPTSLEELVKTGVIRAVPIDPRGGRYYLNAQDHTVHNTKKYDALKLYIKNEKSEN